MPNLLSGRILLSPPSELTDDRNEYLDLRQAQPALGLTPTSSTGYAIVNSGSGVVYTNSLGNLVFSTATITSNLPDGNIKFQASPTGVIQIAGNMVFVNTGTTVTLGERVSQRIPNYYVGESPPSNIKFWEGDQWYNPTQDVLYEYVLDATGVAWVDITGPFFSTSVAYFGYTGSRGDQGYQGSQGLQGPAGGYTGSRGFTGSTGFTGSAGAFAALGYVGSRGYVGSTSRSRVVDYTDLTSITINADTTDLATINNTQISGTFTINAPAGTVIDGQKLMLRVYSTNIQFFVWNAVFIGSTDFPLPTSSSGNGKYDYMGFIYNLAAEKWNIIDKNFGF